MWSNNFFLRFGCLSALLVCLGYSGLRAQKVDTLRLLGNKQVEAEALIGLDSMYNFNFDVAEQRFSWLKQDYPEHPLPYFLLGLRLWWMMMPDQESSAYDDPILQYMDTVIDLSKEMRKSSLTEASFFLASAYGLRSMILGRKGSYLQAAWSAKSFLENMKICEKKGHLSVEILMGRALRNYYIEWVREQKPELGVLLFFFGKGDKKLGIEQMQNVANNAFYVRVEAQDYLMHMMRREGGYREQALNLAAYVHQKYPKNPYFHYTYASFLYQMGKYKQCQKVCYAILDNISCGVPFYKNNSGRISSYYLGWISENLYRDLKTARYYYKKCLDFASQLERKKRGYNARSALSLGNIAVLDQKYKTAKAYYLQSKDMSVRGKKTYKQASEQLRALRRRALKAKRKRP